MRVILISTCILLFNLQTSIKAEIAYIDINFILNKSDVGIYLNKYIQEINNKNLSHYQDRENELLNKEKLLVAQQNILEKSEFDKKLKSLSKEIQDYRAERKKKYR